MIHSTAESQSNELTLKTIFAAELFSKLSEAEQDKIIALIKSLLSRE